MDKKKRICSIVAFLTTIIVIAVILSGFRFKKLPVYSEPDKSSSNEVTVELFYNSPCESCKENVKFDESVRKSILEVNKNAKITCIAYNVFKESDKEYMEKRMKTLGISDTDVKLPFALIDGKLYKGTYEEIGNQIGTDISQQKDVKEIVDHAAKTDSILLFFTTYSCDNCAEVKKFLQESLKEEYKIKTDQGNTVSKVKLIECNIINSENLELLRKLMKQYAVPDHEQQVPLIFYQKGYLSGKVAIKENLVKVVESGSAMGFKWKEGEISAEKETIEGKDFLKFVVTGLLNGLNPCSASMLLMVLSVLLMTGKDFIRGSFSYMAGKIVAYVAMGIGAFLIFSVIKESLFNRIEQFLIAGFGVLALILSLLNFIDFLNARKGNYGRIIVQLPKKLRNFNHRTIKKLENVPGKVLLPVLFVLGLVISAGEFFCTGQIYAATILYMVQQEQEMNFLIFLILLTYVLAMCIPQGIIIFIINKSRNLLKVSRLTLKGMPAVKLIYAILFLVIFILLLLF